MEASKIAQPRQNLYSTLGKEVEFAKSIARTAGNMMKAGFKYGMSYEIKADSTPVSVVDKQINRMIIDEVKVAFPNYGVVGEEESSARREENWVADPVDGTMAFTRGIPTSAFSLALVDKNGRPRLGVIHDPWLDRTFVAERDKGAYLNGSLINVSSKSSVAGAVIGHCGIRFKTNLCVSPFRDPLQDAGAMIGFDGPIVYMHMLVAAGELDAAITPGECHDLAAAKILIDEAQGRMTDITGKEQDRYDAKMKRNIASNGLIHDALIEVMRKSPHYETISAVTA